MVDEETSASPPKSVDEVLVRVRAYNAVVSALARGLDVEHMPGPYSSADSALDKGFATAFHLYSKGVPGSEPTEEDVARAGELLREKCLEGTIADYRSVAETLVAELSPQES